MNRLYFLITAVAICLIHLLSGCGRESGEDLTEFELIYGIGPITERVTLSDEINPELALRGKMIFDTLCIACHQLDAVVTAPRLRNITNQRNSEFILNYILNPEEMSQRHPTGRQLSEEYPGVKSRLGIEQEDAFALLEFLRLAAAGETD